MSDDIRPDANISARSVADPVADAQELIRTELAHAHAPCVTSSFQSDCVVLLHLLSGVRAGVPVLFLDTHHHFAETLAYADEIRARLKLDLRVIQADAPMPGLWRASTLDCCALHKTGPLFRALESHDLWFTALRREHSPSRASMSLAGASSLPTGRIIRKVSPLAAWSQRDVETYAAVHELPLLSLYANGYTSIGCEPCTQLPVDITNPRSGRWGGAKLECGIHTEFQSTPLSSSEPT